MTHEREAAIWFPVYEPRRREARLGDPVHVRRLGARARGRARGLRLSQAARHARDPARPITRRRPVPQHGHVRHSTPATPRPRITAWSRSRGRAATPRLPRRGSAAACAGRRDPRDWRRGRAQARHGRRPRLARRSAARGRGRALRRRPARCCSSATWSRSTRRCCSSSSSATRTCPARRATRRSSLVDLKVMKFRDGGLLPDDYRGHHQNGSMESPSPASSASPSPARRASRSGSTSTSSWSWATSSGRLPLGDGAGKKALPRVVILGGGVAGMTAAMELSRPGWQQRYESITRLPARLAARRQGRQRARRRTSASRSTACTSGSASTTTPSGCCASATTSSRATRRSRSARSRTPSSGRACSSCRSREAAAGCRGSRSSPRATRCPAFTPPSRRRCGS